MGDDSLERLRKLEDSDAARQEILETSAIFLLPWTVKPFSAVGGKPSAVASYLNIGEQLTFKCHARGT